MRACRTKNRRISGVDRRDELRLPVPPLEEEQRRDRPVAGVVPGDLRRHHLRVAHDRVLPVVEPQERVEQPQVGRVERLDPRRDVLAARVAA